MSGDQPIQIESDKLEVRENGKPRDLQRQCHRRAGTDLAEGRQADGLLRQGWRRLGGDRQRSAIDRLQVDDKVYVKSDNQVATGDSGTFDMKTEVLVLSGKEVVLSEGNNVLVGCKLTVADEDRPGPGRRLRRPRQRPVPAG